MGRYFVILAACAAAAAACGRDEVQPGGVRCGDITIPGVVVNVPGIQLAIRNRQGLAVAVGTTVTALTTSQQPTTGFVEDSLISSVFVGPGTYSARVTKPFYRDTTLSNVVVVPGVCTPAQITKLPVVLTLAPGAPPVRSVAVFSTTFLATPGTQAHLVALVDADSGLSRAATWRVSDTTMARIDQAGVVTSKCSTRGGTDTVIATSVADPTLSGRTTFGVGATASCP